MTSSDPSGQQAAAPTTTRHSWSRVVLWPLDPSGDLRHAEMLERRAIHGRGVARLAARLTLSLEAQVGAVEDVWTPTRPPHHSDRPVLRPSAGAFPTSAVAPFVASGEQPAGVTVAGEEPTAGRTIADGKRPAGRTVADGEPPAGRTGAGEEPPARRTVAGEEQPQGGGGDRRGRAEGVDAFLLANEEERWQRFTAGLAAPEDRLAELDAQLESATSGFGPLGRRAGRH